MPRRALAPTTLACLCALASAARADAPPPHVVVRSTSPCVDAFRLSEVLSSVLVRAAGTASVTLRVEVAAVAAPDGTRLELRAFSPDGALLWDRAEPVPGADCGSVERLAETWLSTALRALPVEAWTALPAARPPDSTPPAAPPPGPEPVIVHVPEPVEVSDTTPFVCAAALAGLDPASGTIELSAGVRFPRGPTRVLGAAVAAVEYAGPLGGGHPVAGRLLLEVGVLRAFDPLEASLSVRAGSFVAWGVDYADDARDVALWLDVTAAAARAVGPWRFGAELTVPITRHTLASASGAERQVSSVRVGPTATYTW